MSLSDIEIISFINADKGLKEAQVIVNVGLNKEFDRIPHSKYESTIEDTWKVRYEANPKIFNGLKYRLHSINYNKDQGKVYLNIGLTCYKDFLGTNCAPHAGILQEEGIADHGNSSIYMSDTLAVGGLVLTSDHRFVVMCRSHYVSEAQGLLDRPGGHAEPEMTEGFSHDQGLAGVTPTAVVSELFNSIINEIVDEINIPRETLFDVTLMGFLRNKTTGRRPAAEFLIRCSLTSGEVLSLYQAGGQKEADESVGLYCWTEDELLIAGSKAELTGRVAPCLLGSAQLYSQCAK